MDNFLWEEKWMLFASFYKPKNVKKIMDQDAGLPSMDGWNVKILFSDRVGVGGQVPVLRSTC